MKLRVGANWDIAFLDAVKGTSVDALFGKLPFDIVGGARPGFVLPQIERKDVETYIKACHDRGLEFSYLLNAPCLGNLQYSKKGYGQIIELLEWIDQAGADSVTVGIPYLVDLVRKRFPRFKVKVSTIARVNTVRKALQYEDMGVEEIIIDEHINREFKTLEAIRKAVKCNLELIVNNICLWQCPYNFEHVNHDGHASREGEEDRYCYLQYPGYLCLYRKLMDPVELLKSPWIRPEDIYHYEALGYDHFKITERFKRTPLLLENFKTKDCNQISCSNCRYCETVFEKVAVVKKEEVERAAQKVKHFSEKLVSGEIFNIPSSHLIFRIPFFKSSLIYLLNWRRKREQHISS